MTILNKIKCGVPIVKQIPMIHPSVESKICQNQDFVKNVRQTYTTLHFAVEVLSIQNGAIFVTQKPTLLKPAEKRTTVIKLDDNYDNHSFAFTLDSFSSSNDTTRASSSEDTRSVSLFIDSGASVQIITNRENFIQFNEDFKPDKHVIEHADGAKVDGLAKGQGDAVITLHDRTGKPHDIVLVNALFIPSFNQDIISVPAMTQDGASFSFSCDSDDSNNK